MANMRDDDAGQGEVMAERRKRPPLDVVKPEPEKPTRTTKAPAQAEAA